MKKADIFACLFVLITGIILLLFQFKTDTASEVEIYSNGEIFGKYDLYSENLIDVITSYGQNTVCIDNGKVYVSYSTCEDKDEILQGKISRSGQSLICLPNKLVVCIKGRRADIDSVSY